MAEREDGIRLECLRMALELGLPLSSARELIDTADALYQFVRGLRTVTKDGRMFAGGIVA